MTTDLFDDSTLSNYFDAKEYWEQRLGVSPSLRDVGYSSLGTRYNEWLYRLRKTVVRRQAAALNLDLSHARVLDIGSGTGFYIQLWHEMGAMSVSGCDLTQASVSHLQRCFPSDTFHQVDIGGDLPGDMLPGLDVISAFDVLFHIVDDARFNRAISNISHLLSSDGVFFFTDLFLHRETQRSTHQVSRSLRDIELALARAGLEIVDRRPVFVLMNEPIDTQSRLLHFTWKVLMYPVTKSERIGAIWGAVLYPIDLFLSKVLTESPTAEIMVCRKALQGQAGHDTCGT